MIESYKAKLDGINFKLNNLFLTNRLGEHFMSETVGIEAPNTYNTSAVL